jgi:hypothetical protein
MNTDRRSLLKLLGVGAVVTATPTLAQTPPSPSASALLPTLPTTAIAAHDNPHPDGNYENPFKVSRSDLGLSTKRGLFS